MTAFEVLAALANIATAGAVVVGAWQLVLVHRLSITNFEDTFAKEYRELMAKIPTKARHCGVHRKSVSSWQNNSGLGCSSYKQRFWKNNCIISMHATDSLCKIVSYAKRLRRNACYLLRNVGRPDDRRRLHTAWRGSPHFQHEESK
jgi:hypothetical protein